VNILQDKVIFIQFYMANITKIEKLNTPNHKQKNMRKSKNKKQKTKVT